MPLVASLSNMFTANEYNALLTVNLANEQAKSHVALKSKLFEIIAQYQLQNTFGVRLVHKHFSIYPSEVAVFQPMIVTDIGPITVMGPLPVSDLSKFSPKNFAVKDSRLVPYEFTAEQRPSVTDYPDFAAAFATEVASANATSVFGLSALADGDATVLSEFELPDLRTTVMVPPWFLPEDEGSTDIQTDWAVTTASSQPTTLAHCRITQKSGHVGVRQHCRETTTTGHVSVSKWQREERLDKIIRHVYDVAAKPE